MESHEGFNVNGRGSPEMSVVIVADCYETIRKTMNHIRAQTVRDRLEIVIVTQSADTLGLDPTEVADFLRVRVIEFAAIIPLSLALAAGVRRASAPIIALAESHAYPGPGWAEALLEAHRHPWAVVGPVIGNANPGSLTSWASLFLDYGGCVETTAVGVVDYLPGHNTSYKREIVLQYDSRLEAMMEAEILLHWDMRARGYQLYLEPTVKTYHLNVTQLSSWLPERFYTGRRFAAARALPWSPLRRLLYAGGTPLIPLVRLLRVLRDVRRSTRRHELLPRLLPPLLVGLVVSAVGELIGYTCGAGDATARLAEMELHKARHVTQRDRQTLDTSLMSMPQ